MPRYTSPGSRKQREDLVTAKRQTVFLVVIITTSFSLWPTRFIFVRDAIIVAFMAWVTSKAFDLAAIADGAWENVPYWVKMLVPVDPNIQIPAPFDCIKSFSHNSFTTTRLKLHRLAPVAKYGCEGLLAILAALLDCFMREDTKRMLGPEPAAGLDDWIALLVVTPPEHDYGPGSLKSTTDENKDSLKLQPISWESCDFVSSLPSITALETFKIHMSFCLVSRKVWEDPSLPLVKKFEAGLYWEIGIKRKGEGSSTWPSQRVQTIQAAQVLGLLAENSRAINTCQDYFAVLQQDWDYRKISWNDIDFAIILGFLVTGAQAATTCQALFYHFSQLRIDQALIPRRNDAFGLSMAALGATILTGGLAAPITAPMLVGSMLPVMGKASNKPFSPHDAAMWQHREDACQKLLRDFHELKAIFGMPVDPFCQLDF